MGLVGHLKLGHVNIYILQYYFYLFIQMVRKYKWKTERIRVIDDIIKHTVKKVLDENHSRKSVSEDFSIPIKYYLVIVTSFH